LPPDIISELVTPAGKKVAIFQTGPLPQGNSVMWRRYAGIFVTPPDITTLVLTMEDITHGGCGNDFALDDIAIRECVKTIPVTKTGAKSAPKSTKKQVTTVNKPVRKTGKPQTVKKDSADVLIKKTVTDKPEITLKKTKDKPAAIPLPKVLLTRANPLIKRIEAPAGEISIELYDNGQIDGDTVSIYHNNELIVSRAGLSKKPISFKIKVDATQPHHELIMVANNLGSIPPNTSLMIVTVDNERSEVFISSSEQKNAKLVIDLRE
jgi:hypothetical protein